MDFKELGISSGLVKGLTEMNILTPSDIQQKMIPLLMQGSTDVVGQAQTGTGKTAAFGLPLLEQIDANNGVIQGLIFSLIVLTQKNILITIQSIWAWSFFFYRLATCSIGF